MKREPIRTPSGCIDGSAMIAAGRGRELAQQDPTDYADTIDHLDNFAEGLELEATYGNPADTPRLTRAAKLIRRAMQQLQPLAQAEEITAADPLED